MSDLCLRADEINEKIKNKAGIAAKLVVASKYAGSPQLKELYDCGYKVFGENRAQELSAKAAELPEAEWHFIGHLQTNKVKQVVGLAKLIHSVDSLKLAKAIDAEAAKKNLIQEVLIQVNIGGESEKFGIKPENLDFLADAIIMLSNVKLKGLMAIMPYEKISQLRPYFKDLKRLYDGLKTKLPDTIEFLSAGMSNDWELALEEGANILRLGSVIFAPVQDREAGG